jgi:predicted HTH transcriptional regulator
LAVQRRTMIECAKITEYRENNRLEVKKAVGGMPQSIWETYSAFANTNGGVILLGIEELPDKSLNVIGLDNPEKYVTDFWNTINNTQKVSVNYLRDQNVQIVPVDGKNIIAIEVPRAERALRPIYLGNNYNNVFRRNNDGDYRCSSAISKAMFRDAAPETQDAVVLGNLSANAFNADTAKRFKTNFKNKHMGHVWENITDEEFFLKMGALALGEDNKIHPTAAGLLMFGNEYDIVREFPQYFLDYQEQYDVSVRWTDRFTSSNGEWSGNIYDFFYKAYTALIQNPNIKRPFVIADDGLTRKDDTNIHEAIREALANCLIHADYYGNGGIVVKNYIDKIVIANPGTLRVSLDYALAGGYSNPRNSILIKMFSFLEIGERAGSGIPKIFYAWKNNGLASPALEENLELDRTILTLATQGSDKISASSDKCSDKVGGSSDKKSAIMEIAKKSGSVKTSELADALGVTTRHINKLLNDLVARGLLVAEGKNKGRLYRIL